MRDRTAVQTAGPGSGGGLACHRRRDAPLPVHFLGGRGVVGEPCLDARGGCGVEFTVQEGGELFGRRVRIGAIMPHKDVRWPRNARSFWRA